MSEHKEESNMHENRFDPRILGFLCNWCSYSGADLAGISRLQSSPCLRVIRVMCTGRIDPGFVLQAFASGADGVLLAGCHPGDCHYQEGNYKCMRRFHLIRKMLTAFGIDEDRLRLEWISASEAEKFAQVTLEMEERIRELGPLNLNESMTNSLALEATAEATASTETEEQPAPSQSTL
jgi:F420-non-reducing hydrogenase iron-sulfur subunit